MTETVINAVKAWRETMDELDKYEELLLPLVDKERSQRRAVIDACFPDGQEKHEGTTNLEVWPGWVLKTVVKIDRKVDEAALTAITEQLHKQKVNTDLLVRRKPELVVKEYRGLNEEAKKIFDQCLIIKPGSPNLELFLKDPG